MISTRLMALAAALVLVTAACALADQHTAGVPALSSRPGAAYTIYVNVAGFNYDGLWHDHPTAPGITPAVNDRLPTDTFDAADIAQIKNIWTGMAQSFIGFNVNVTTVDPYDALNDPTPTDAERQAFYDATPNMMHTVVGSQIRPPGTPGVTPMNKWFSDGADGVSPGIGVVAGRVDGTTSLPGQHTNWMFSEAQAGAATGGIINGNYIGAISAHENAHSFGLFHQGDFAGETLINEYTNGDDAGNVPGSYVAIIGNADNRQRIQWRNGDADTNGRLPQNDVGLMLSTNTVAFAGPGGLNRTGVADLHLIDDGIGNTLATATPLPLVGNAIDVTSPLSKGVIVPLSESNPNPIGVSNYTQDWFSFFTNGLDAISLTLTNGTDFLVPGVADSPLGAGNLRSTLSIYDSLGTLVGAGLEDSSTLFASYSSLLGAGTYFAQINSFGGHNQDTSVNNYNPSQYYDMGAFFLTGSGFDVVPEPGSLVLFGLALVSISIRRRTR